MIGMLFDFTDDRNVPDAMKAPARSSADPDAQGGGARSQLFGNSITRRDAC